MGVERTFDLVVLHEDGGRDRVSLAGELDLASGPDLEGAVEAACAAGARSVTVDLSGVAFIDSTGLRALLRAHEICVSHGAEYRIDPSMTPAVTRMIEIVGIGRLPFIGLP